MTNLESNSGTGQGNRVVRRTVRRVGVESVRGENAAIYCRISRTRDKDQTGVDRQEKICRAIARRLGLKVAKAHVFVDNNRSAWQRDRKRPQWDELLATMAEGRVTHVIVYHPDRLMRQPHDLEELLRIAGEHRVTLHGEANRRDLTDPDDVFILRIEVAHACRESDDKSRRIGDKFEEKAEQGTPHGGKRIFGYTKDRMHVIEEEADILRWIFTSYLDGASARTLARQLNARMLSTANGAHWSPTAVLRLLSSRHVAGIYVFRGEEIGTGAWPAIIDRGTWDEVQVRRQYRAAPVAEARKNARYYLLRGVVVCTRCGTLMSGTQRIRPRTPGQAPDVVRSLSSYVCTRTHRLDDLKCSRRIDAEPLEALIQDAAIEILETLEVTDPASITSLPQAEQDTVTADEAQLRELNAMWANKDIKTSEYLTMKKTIEARIRKAQKKTVVRPTGMIADLVGPDARAKWHDQTDERKNASLRFLFNAVLVGESTRPVGDFDFDRIDIDPNPMD